MNNQQDDQSLNKEKLFQDTVPRSRVQLDIVKRLKAVLDDLPTEVPEKIISYQEVVRENGEYYLLYQGSKNLKPLVEYLNKNEFSAQKIIKEYKAVVKLLQNFSLIKKLFPAGINAFNFWIDEKENIFLMPEEILCVKRNYEEFEIEAPSADYFKAPEIIAGEQWQLQSYLFNISAVFYYFLSSETIFSDQDNAKVLNKIQTEKILELKALVPEVSTQLNDFIMSMLAKDKNERPELKKAASELKKAAADNDFKLESFLERKNLIDNKILKKKRRNENIKLYFRQSWKVILFFLIIGGGFIWGLTSGQPAVITTDTPPAQVVNYFYDAVATKNINLANEAVDFDLGEMQRLISESHVIEKMQGAFSDQSASDGGKSKVYSLEQLEIEELSATENKYRYQVNYQFNYRDQQGRYSSEIEDELLVEKIDGIWRITAIKGGFKDMITGEYPWREK